ncbi:putative sulfate exporter family transporter [Bacillus salacetis]|uniref:Putative sulfate exporter family transporter n=1 Tax=Bacillus salacetis TaxID=2315464 RepID=A0A3A1R0D0_9BACI|nr:putative sulfate exporter family transporter [Bacillus salacetis]RIW33291.1 putative sulfate exporter family transporter [Bacillus salacetis]
MNKLQYAFKNKLADRLPKWSGGITLLLLIAGGAKYLGTLFPLVGSILFAIVIGIIINNTMGVHEVFQPGLSLTLKKLLKAAVVMLGVSLSFTDILHIGRQSLLIILVSVILGIAITVWLGKLLNMDRKLALLIGVGTSICGATAISAVKGVIDSDDNETAYAISIIVFFNLIAFFAYPVIGHLLDLSATAFGIWAGTAVHDTSSSIAVGYVYGNDAGQVATTVKLARTLFLLPLILVLPLLLKTNAQSGSNAAKKAFPWFVLMFLAVSIINSFGIIPSQFEEFLTDIAKFIIIMVMGAVGLQVNLKQFAKLGFKPLIAGLVASLTVSVISLLMIIYL